MQIDRKTFLSLVGTLGAVVACGGAQQDQKAVIVVMDPIDAGAPPVAPTPVATTHDAGAQAAPEVVDPTKPFGIWAADYDAKVTRSCNDLKCPGPTQEAFVALRSACRTIAGRLTTETFQRYMSCVSKINNSPLVCGLSSEATGTDPGNCLEGWYSTPTLTPESEAKCKPIVSKCARQATDPSKALTMHQCRQVMSVTQPKGEKKMIHCVAEYCDESLTLCHGSLG